MSVIAIDAAMLHTRAEPEDEALVQSCLDAAEDSAQAFMQRRFYADADALAEALLTVATLRADARAAYQLAINQAETIGDCETREEARSDARRRLSAELVHASHIQDGIIINPSINAACLLITGHLYAHREDVVIGTISSKLPRGSEHLLFPYRVGLGV